MNKNEASHLIQGLLTKRGIVNDNVIARAIGTIIYEVTTTKSGLISTTLLDSYGYRCKTACEEHYNSRQQVGSHIVSNDLSFDRLIDILAEATKVHLVSSEENIRLSPIQNGVETRLLPWQDQYKLAGVVLTNDIGTAPRYFYRKYVINGVEYSNIDEAVKGVGEPEALIRSRCSSKAKKWAHYKCY